MSKDLIMKQKVAENVILQILHLNRVNDNSRKFSVKFLYYNSFFINPC